MKCIIVKKNEGHVYFVRILMAVLSAVIIGLLFWEPMYALLMFMPAGILVPLWIYYESWQIIFDKEMIIKKVFFRSCCSYSWNQLRKVIRSHSYTEGEQIRMLFRDGKAIIFRLDDHNALKAVDRISRHHSIERNTND